MFYTPYYACVFIKKNWKFQYNSLSEIEVGRVGLIERF